MSQDATIEIPQSWTKVIEPQHSLLQINWKEIWQYRDLIYLLVKRDFTAQYKQTILRLASSRDELRIVADQFGAHTGAALLANASTHIATRCLRHGRENFPFGLYHLAAGGETSWHGFAQHIVANATAANSPL
jgi:hypothetical protein